MSQTIAVRSIRAFRPEDWNLCFPGALEDWGYYLATEDAGLTGFEFRYFAVIEEGRLAAATPAFFAAYRLDTTARGGLKRIMLRLTGVFPRLMTLRLACLGSPVAETCDLGFAPWVDDGRKPELLDALLAAFEKEAAAAGIRLMGVKDAPQTQDTVWSRALDGRYRRMTGLPTAVLPIDFADLDAYLGRLGRATRKDMRRKLRSRATVRVEYRRNIDDVLDQVLALYEQTRARGDMQFERLTSGWFTGVLAAAGEHGGCFLYWIGDRLAGFNLVLHDGRRMIDKFVGIDADLGRSHNLYFLSWMTNVDFCLAHGIGCYQSGQAEYGPKKRLGSGFVSNWIWFRHANPAVDAGLAALSRLLRLDRGDPDVEGLPEASR